MRPLTAATFCGAAMQSSAMGPLAAARWVLLLAAVVCGAVERDSAAAFAAVRAGRGSLLFRHVRKAAGSSLLKALEDVAVDLMRRNNRSREIFMMHMEFSAFPAACFRARPEALYVTVVRESLSRVHSEYWYAGPAVDNATVYLGWIRPKAVVREAIPREDYVDNLFTRSLSGRCVAPTAAEAPRRAPPGDPRPTASDDGGLL